MNKETYNEYVKQITPKHSVFGNCWKAFLVGGAICVLGQAVTAALQRVGMPQEDAASWCSLLLVLLGVLLTGPGWYARLAKLGGAGTLVPITGFANSVAASAIEFQKEGQVFGIGCKIFTIAGPVILYGIFASWVLGIIYMIF
ncbi:MAG: SpoVA/SpoVAEb family sporulation membrane protein [Eubacteriales bacterium]|nr:SpoVA/SpoVAEb family sporulation membrane protein [Eubacteriales bacterium]